MLSCLAFDIGGTNCRMAVYSVGKDGQAAIEALDKAPTDAVHTAEELHQAVGERLGEAAAKCSACAAAVAAPVVGCKASLTNAGLVLDAGRMQQLFGMPVRLINDYAAVCYAAEDRSKENVEQLWGNEPLSGSRAVFGAGTGLGCAAVMQDAGLNGGNGSILLSEGGHVSCSFEGAEERAFADFIRRQKEQNGGGEDAASDYVSMEDVLSGRGLKSLVLAASGQSLSGRECGRRYLSQDPDQNTVGRLYARFMGRFARNWALSTMCTGGLWIAGGIAVQNRAVAASQSFRKEFVRGRHAGLLEAMPIYLFRNENFGLRGACACAWQLLQNS